MTSTPYTFTHGLDYASIVAASEKVAWSVDTIFRDRRFDASKPLVPAWGLVGIRVISGHSDHHPVK